MASDTKTKEMACVARNLAIYKKTEQISKYIEDNGNQSPHCWQKVKCEKQEG